MDIRPIVLAASRWATRIALTFVAAVFWGVALAMAASYLLGYSSNQTQPFVALPVGVLVTIWLWPRLPMILKAAGYDE